MSKTGEIPYTWKQMEEQIAEAILCQASILSEFGPALDLVADFLGIDRNAFSEMDLEQVRDIDISRHAMHQHCKVAYDYAYQLRDFPPVEALDAWHAVDGMLQGFPQTDADGEPSPFCRLNDFPLRRMLETFAARILMFGVDYTDDYAPSIRELALLANMTVPAVRTSLSKEGFRLEKSAKLTRSNQEDSSFKLNHEDAKLWLSRRRGFIPQRSTIPSEQVLRAVEELADPAVSFPEVTTKIVALRNLNADELADASGVDQSWFRDLLAGNPVAPDLRALQSLARALKVPVPAFVAAGIRHLLERLQAAPQS